MRLHEAGTYPRHRVCGEFISGVSDKILEQLGILACFDGAARLETMAWFYGAEHAFTGRLPTAARGLSRHLLDRRLRDRLLDVGGQVFENSRVRPEVGMLWCAGRRLEPGKWTGLKAHYEGLTMEADLEMHMGRGCYVGLCRIENSLVNVCGLFPADVSRRCGGDLRKVLEESGLARLAARLQSASQCEGSRVGISAFRLGWQRRGKEGVLGDAAAMIPPFTGNGMSMAIESGFEAAGCFQAFAAGDTSWGEACEALRMALRKRFARRMRLAAVLHPFLTRPTGQFFLAAAARTGCIPLGALFGVLRQP